MTGAIRDFDPASLSAFVLVGGLDRKLAQRAVEELNDFVEEFRAGSACLGEAGPVDDPQAAAEAIVGMTGSAIERLYVIPAASATDAFVQCCGTRGIKLLPRFLFDNCRDEIIRGLGMETRLELIYEVMLGVGDAVMFRLQDRLKDFFDRLGSAPVANDIVLIPASCIFHMLAYAMLGDVEKTEAAIKLFRLCRRGLPLGETILMPGSWVVLTA